MRSVGWIGTHTVVFAIACLAAVAAACAEEPAAEAGSRQLAPGEPGPYPVGVTTLRLIDPSRIDYATGQPRSLLTEIWYPATDDARDLPKNELKDFLLGGHHPRLNDNLKSRTGKSLEEMNAKFTNRAVRDARVRDGKFPLVIFSHGHQSFRFQSSFWCDHLASHGYIVMSPDHTGNASATLASDRLVFGDPSIEARALSGIDRPRDVRFLIDWAENANAGGDSRFTNRIDVERVGAAGHSMGGFSATRAVEFDDRIDAVLAMAPVFGERSNFNVPTMLMLGAEDATLLADGKAMARNYYRQTKADRYWVELVRGGHMSFSDAFQFNPQAGDGVGRGVRVTAPGEAIDFLPMNDTYEIVNAFSAAFFGLYLKGQEDYREFLRENRFGQEVVYEFAESNATLRDSRSTEATPPAMNQPSPPATNQPSPPAAQ